MPLGRREGWKRHPKRCSCGQPWTVAKRIPTYAKPVTGYWCLVCDQIDSGNRRALTT